MRHIFKRVGIGVYHSISNVSLKVVRGMGHNFFLASINEETFGWGQGGQPIFLDLSFNSILSWDSDTGRKLL